VSIHLHPIRSDASAALLIRGLFFAVAAMGPGSASRHFMPRRVRDAKARFLVPAAQIVRALPTSTPGKTEGAGNAGRWPHPQASWAEKESAHKSVQVGRHDRHSLRNGFTAYFALSPEYRA
jgi:hypothetical protein